MSYFLFVWLWIADAPAPNAYLLQAGSRLNTGAFMVVASTQQDRCAHDDELGAYVCQPEPGHWPYTRPGIFRELGLE